jgi:hypothetical protein
VLLLSDNEKNFIEYKATGPYTQRFIKQIYTSYSTDSTNQTRFQDFIPNTCGYYTHEHTAYVQTNIYTYRNIISRSLNMYNIYFKFTDKCIMLYRIHKLMNFFYQIN